MVEAFDIIAEAYVMTKGASGTDTHFLHFPPGHFYSPLPSREELAHVSPRVFAPQKEILGIDLRTREQFRLYARLAKWYPEMPFQDSPQPGIRYYFNNVHFCYADAFWLYAMMRELRPRRIIEVGSGFSSSIMLDVRDRFFDDNLEISFIEPYPERLHSLVDVENEARVTLYEKQVQDVPIDVFSQLDAGDFLFIDSSHVGKVGSDVLYLLHTVLPSLKPGVNIHFHDIFYPFEYPLDWFNRGWAWNECYFLRTFLQYNSSFAVKLFGHYLTTQHAEMMAKATPICLKNAGGSLWLEKVQ